MVAIMTDLEFYNLAEITLQRVEQRCDHLNETTDIDLDSQRVGCMVTLTFKNGSQIIVNLQKPLHELWLAAKEGGFHFKWDGNVWADTKGQGEFFACLSRLASLQAGERIVFNF